MVKLLGSGNGRVYCACSYTPIGLLLGWPLYPLPQQLLLHMLSPEACSYINVFYSPGEITNPPPNNTCPSLIFPYTSYCKLACVISLYHGTQHMVLLFTNPWVGIKADMAPPKCTQLKSCMHVLLYTLTWIFVPVALLYSEGIVRYSVRKFHHEFWFWHCSFLGVQAITLTISVCVVSYTSK